MTVKKSSLEIALDYYDLQLSKYERETSNKIPDDIRKVREKEASLSKIQLVKQRRHLETLASIQCKLDEYREQGREATKGTVADREKTVNVLKNEAHHPSSKLEILMIANGNPKPSPSLSAHHIVAGKGRVQATYQARVHMHVRGIRINDPDNGCWLPKTKKDTPHWTMPDALSHRQNHTKYYELGVSRVVISQRTESAIRSKLRYIAKLLQSNKFPTKEPVATR